MRNFFFRFRHLDITLEVTCFLLLLIGLSLIYSTSLNGDRSSFLKQAVYALIAVVLFFFFAFFDLSKLSKIGRYLYLFLVAALVLVLFAGHSVQGSSRWFNLKFISFQPAEFAKLVIILVLARFFALRRGEINIWKNVLLSFVYVLIPIFLIAKEPDLGSALVILIIWLGMLFLSNVNKKIFIYIFLIFSVVSIGSWKFVLKDYQKNRIMTFVNPQLDPRGKGYNVQQAIISVGSGKVLGTGLGRGLQSQLKFLPERQTDFVFASAAEELGLLGSAVIIILYFLLLYRFLAIYAKSRDDLDRFIVAGVFFLILSQAVINIGMNIGLLPVTGIPLPFISYGGSSLITVAIGAGVVEAVAVRSKGLRL